MAEPEWNGPERRAAAIREWRTEGEIELIASKVADEKLSALQETLNTISQAVQKVAQQNVVVLGDKKSGIPGLLPKLVNRQRRIMRRQDAQEELTARRHEENQRRQDAQDKRQDEFEKRVDKALQGFRKEVRAVRRNQHRWYGRVWGWCLQKDENDKLKRTRIGVLLTGAGGALTTLRVVWPSLVRHVKAIAHALFG